MGSGEVYRSLFIEEAIEEMGDLGSWVKDIIAMLPTISLMGKGKVDTRTKRGITNTATWKQ